MKHRTARNALLSLVFASQTHAATQVEPGEEVITQILALGVAPPISAPPSGDEVEGPFRQLIIKNVNMIDGTGAPTVGPVTLVIENDRIRNIYGRGTSSLHGHAEVSDPEVRVIDGNGGYVLPGMIDAHVHLGTPIHAFAGYLTDPEYVEKLLLAHGITTIREVGSLMGLGWVLDNKQRAARGEISSPRILAYAFFPEMIESAQAARDWVRAVHKRGADGVKFLGAGPDMIKAAIDESRKLGLGTAFHHAQLAVAHMNVLDSARAGLQSVEHWYGLPEAMFEDRTVQHYSHDFNYSNEQHRFSEAGRLWKQSAARGSERWNSTINELVEHDITLVPTFSCYEPNRDLERARTLEWHEDYAMPYMMRAFEPNPVIHGSYHFDWTTAIEVDWKDNFSRWMSFVNDYKNRGGRVVTGADSGFSWGVYGFGYIRELELLQEAGFHPLEVIQSATLNGAQLLGLDKDLGTIELGKKADLVILDENPLANFKVMYGTGHYQLDTNTGKTTRTGAVRYTVKDGRVYNAQKLLEDVRQRVADQKALEASTQP